MAAALPILQRPTHSWFADDLAISEVIMSSFRISGATSLKSLVRSARTHRSASTTLALCPMSSLGHFSEGYMEARLLPAPNWRGGHAFLRSRQCSMSVADWVVFPLQPVKQFLVFQRTSSNYRASISSQKHA